MNIEVTNSTVTITDPSDDVTSFVESTLKYVDKAKQYQLKRMSKSRWLMAQPSFKKLQSEVEGKMYEKTANTLTFSSCFLKTLTDEFPNIQYTDLRKSTGPTLPLPWVNKPHNLRPYQEEAVLLMDSEWRGIVNFATGLGKTLVATHTVKQCRKKSLIVCPSESVAKQFYTELVNAFGPLKVGYYGGGKKKISDITVGIAASVSKGVADFQKQDLGLIIVDEVHHVPATTFFTIAAGLSNVGKIFGLTATDFRSDGKDIMITGGCGSVMISRDIKWGVANGWLAEPYFIVKQIQTTGKDYKDDKGKSYKEHILGSPLMMQQIENDCKKMMAAGKSILCLVDEVEHGKQLSAALGIPFATGVDKLSSGYVANLNKGKIPGLVGTDSKVGEGTDTKNVDVLILANFVGSKGPVIQAIGRGLRKQGSKTMCIILDYIPLGSTMLTRHGWGRVKVYKSITDKVKIC